MASPPTHRSPIPPPSTSSPHRSDSTASSDKPPAQWHLAAAVAAWLLPGLGHYLLGQRRRGIILALSIGLLWLSGVLIGGMSSIDREAHPAWFATMQMLTAPSLVVNFYHQRLRARTPGGPQPRVHPDDPAPAYVPSFGRTEEQGLLFTALAGLLNLLAIIDVIYRDPQDQRYRPPATLEVEGRGAKSEGRGARSEGRAGAGPRLGMEAAPTPNIQQPTFNIALLAWLPLLNPIPIHQWWLPPLIWASVSIAVTYKTIKMGDLRRLPREATLLAVQIVAFMIVAAATLWILTEWL